MIKILSLYIITTVSISSFANIACVKSYTTPSQKWIEESNLAFRSIREILKPNQKQIELSIRSYHKAVPQIRENKKIDEFQKIIDNKMPLEIAEIEAKRLAKSGFLLGPVHEYIFSLVLNIHAYGFESDGFLATHSINKYKDALVSFQERIKDSSPEGKAYRKQIAQAMSQLTSTFLDSFPNDSNDFLLKGDNEKLEILNKSFSSMAKYSFHTDYFFKTKYKTSKFQIFKIASALLESKDLPGRNDFFTSLYENSLLEISGNILSKTRNSKSALLHKIAALSPILATPIAMYTSLPVNEMGMIVPFTLMSGVGVVALSNQVYQKTTEYPTKAWIGAKNYFNKNKINKKLMTSLESSTNDISAEELAKIENIEDQLDLKFSYIKYDLAKDLNSEINLPTWGQELATGVNNISLRINVLLEKYQNLVSQLDPTVKKILTEKNSFSSTEIKKLNFNKNTVILQLVNLLIDLQAIKTDTLSLSVALDQFIIRAQDAKTKSQVVEYFLTSKENQF